VPGRIVEPGHQFEWAWLLLRSGSEAARAAALALVSLGEQHGIRHGIAVNALLDDFSVHDPEARLWPQTERLKVAARLAVEDPQHWQAAAEAGAALLRYLDVSPRGLWHDTLTADGRFLSEPAPASTFYHLVAAIGELGQMLARSTAHDY
jgi:mannose-6-phosphate isomerase